MKIWSQGIFASHAILLIFMIGFFMITLKNKNKEEPNIVIYVLQYVAVIVIMSTGIVIVALDHLVTSNITPFILTCIICGTVMLIRPLISLIIYAASYAAYFYLIGLTVTDQQILQSNRVNGITAVGVGFLLSIIMWRYSYININWYRYKPAIEIRIHFLNNRNRPKTLNHHSSFSLSD